MLRVGVAVRHKTLVGIIQLSAQKSSKKTTLADADAVFTYYL